MQLMFILSSAHTHIHVTGAIVLPATKWDQCGYLHACCSMHAWEWDASRDDTMQEAVTKIRTDQVNTVNLWRCYWHKKHIRWSPRKCCTTRPVVGPKNHELMATGPVHTKDHFAKRPDPISILFLGFAGLKPTLPNIETRGLNSKGN